MNQTNFWNDAAKYGAVIGGASAVCSLMVRRTRYGPPDTPTSRPTTVTSAGTV